MSSNVLIWPLLIGHAGFSVVQIVTPDATAANRLTAVPDLSAGDYVEWGNIQGTGTVVVNDDGTFDADAGVTDFDVYVGNLTDGWGAVATQTIAVTHVLTGANSRQDNTSTAGGIFLLSAGTNLLTWPVLVGHAGFTSVLITAPDLGATERVEASPDLAAGDYVEWGNIQGAGTVTVNADGSFTASAGVTAFDYYVGNLTEGWRTLATQVVIVALAGDGSAAPHTSTAAALRQRHILVGSGCEQQALSTDGAMVAGDPTPTTGTYTAPALAGAERYRCSDRDTADYVAWKYYGSLDGRVIEQVLQANPGMSDYGAELPAGSIINLPAIQRAPEAGVVRLWD